MNFAMNIEHWALIDGYDNYEISSFGRVRNNKTSRIANINTDDKGYYRIQLRKDGSGKTHRVHILVAFAFLEKKEEHTQVDHIDRNRGNNMLSNLRWATRSENNRNASKSKNNTSGIQGVHFDKKGNRWISTWYGEKKYTKSFSVKTYDDQAKPMADEHRKLMAKENGYLNV